MGKENENEKEGEERLVVAGHKISSVGPGKVTGEKVVYEPSNMDLAMKAHYLRVVYMLESPAVLGLGLTVPLLKESLFSLLNYFYETCGRFRRGGAQRPYLKCNDCGMRFVEARSPQTLDEWVSFSKLGNAASFQHRHLVYHHALGPDLIFSPPLFIQITNFKCGGVALGMSWAHVLGDAFSVSHFMNQLAQFLHGKEPPYPPKRDKSPPNIIPTPIKPSTAGPGPGPLSLKQVGPLGDHWTVEARCEMETFSFHATNSQLDQLLKMVGSHGYQTQHFEALCAVIWRAIAKVGPGPKLNTVTVIEHDPMGPKMDDMVLGNNQVVSSVKAHFSVGEAHVKEIVELIHDKAQDERAHITEMVDRDPGGSDFIVYGENLTFVDLGEAGFYEFEVKGFRPKLVNCFVDSIGGEGVVMVLPGPINNDNDRKVKIGGEGKIVTLILPKTYMEATKQELSKDWGLIA